MIEIKPEYTIHEILEAYTNCGGTLDTNRTCFDCCAYSVCPLLTRYKELLKEGVSELIDKYIL